MMVYNDPFSNVLDELDNMHDKKMADYGTTADPYANVRGSADFGIEPWVGAMVRANDKIKRLQKAAKGGLLANESVEDSLLDLAVYAVIGLILFRQSKPLAENPYEPVLDVLFRLTQGAAAEEEDEPPAYDPRYDDETFEPSYAYDDDPRSYPEEAMQG